MSLRGSEKLLYVARVDRPTDHHSRRNSVYHVKARFKLTWQFEQSEAAQEALLEFIFGCLDCSNYQVKYA